jgi:hypothetical protein
MNPDGTPLGQPAKDPLATNDPGKDEFKTDPAVTNTATGETIKENEVKESVSATGEGSKEKETTPDDHLNAGNFDQVNTNNNPAEIAEFKPANFSAEDVNKRAAEYMQPLDPYFDVMDEKLRKNLRGTFAGGKGQLSGAINQQATQQIGDTNLAQRQLSADAFKAAQQAAQGDISGMYHLQNQLGYNTWSQMMNKALTEWQTNQTMAQQTALQGLTHEQQKQILAIQDQYQQAELAAQRLHEESQGNQAMRQAIATGFFAPLVTELLRSQLGLGGGEGSWGDIEKMFGGNFMDFIKNLDLKGLDI